MTNLCAQTMEIKHSHSQVCLLTSQMSSRALQLLAKWGPHVKCYYIKNLIIISPDATG